MKKYLIGMLFLLLLLPLAANAKRKKDKAGKVANGVYVDKQFGFSLDMVEDWKVNIMKNKSNLRLVFVQKNYLVPNDYTNTPDFTKVPRLSVYADTTSLSVYAFVDSVMSDTYKSDQKKELRKEFEILTFAETQIIKDVIPRAQRRIQIAEEKAMMKSVQAKYVQEVPVTASSTAVKRVYGDYGAAIIGVKKGDTVYLFHMVCEWTYYKDIYTQIMGIVNSLKWTDEEG